ncbi:DUF3592 domain-containing protein [Halomarina ordinaria]|uniref:DUF3592 domain-containing protein n=1 Tax=Halomarina ordinaria TaxID=3033939 RepID=A0ABD5UB61_9EURY|nr:DUF3592 domain-containing protein [Halomarina sp. PSRA2]
MSPDFSISIGGRELDPVRGGALALVVGLLVTGVGAYDYTQQSDAVANAVEVDATVTETGTESVSQRRGGPEYRPTVSFDYRYEGTAYTSDDVFPSAVTSTYDTRSAAESALQGYETGDTVTAYVDPDSPSEAFLTDRRSNGPLKFVAIGGLFVLVGGASVVRGLAGR